MNNKCGMCDLLSHGYEEDTKAFKKEIAEIKANSIPIEKLEELIERKQFGFYIGANPTVLVKSWDITKLIKEHKQ